MSSKQVTRISRRQSVGLTMGLIGACASLTGASCTGQETSAKAADNARSYARSLSLAFNEASEKALPSVVTILSSSKEASQPGVLGVIGGTDRQIFDNVGSGVIIESSGLILTNHHVIENATRIDVRLPDGRQYRATETKSDPASDVAIVKIESKYELVPASIGNSDSLRVGDWVLAIGSPFTLETSVSAGIISNTNRRQRLSREVAGQFLQTDAAVNPGNSGGPLIDLDGNVIGINTAISSRNGSFQGIGFAIPIRRAMWVKDELLNYEKVRRAYVGIRIDRVPYAIAQDLDLPESTGGYIRSVTSGYPGDKAGLKTGDVVIRFAGTRIQSPEAFVEVAQSASIGEPVEIVVLRGGKELTLEITPTERRR